MRMMKQRPVQTLLSIGAGLVLWSLLATAQAEEVKPFQLGFVGYGVSVDDGNRENEFSGPGISFQAAVSDSGRSQLALRLTYAQMEHDRFNSLKNDSLEASLLWGRNLNRTGFKWYLGGGIFNDSAQLEGFNRSRNFSGGQLTAGLGYNWEVVALDFWVSGRDRSAYDVGSFRPDSAGALGFSLGLRF